MKIQLKRSNVLDNSAAKVPTAAQLDYGEIAINYNTSDPCIFLKDSNDAVIRIAGAGFQGEFSGSYDDLTNKPTIGNGSITLNAGNGLSASGDNATANQTGNTTRTLSVLPANSTISVTASGIAVNNSAIAPAYSNVTGTPTIGNGAIQINAGNGLSASGSNGTANQTGTTTRTLSAVAADNSISVAAGGISVVDANLTPSWSNIQGKPSTLPNANSLTPSSYISGSAYNGSSAQTWSVNGSSSPSNGKLAAWDSGPDLNARLFRSTYANESNISGGMMFRNNNSSDNYIRCCSSQSAIRGWLSVPTRTGGDASGTWGISISGNAATATSASSATTSSSCSGNAATATTASQVSISYSNNSNSTYQMLWGSSNSVYGTSGIYCNPSNNAFYAQGWHYTTGSNGFYNETHGGGWNMSDATWFRIYNGKALYVSNTIASTGDVYTNYSDMRLKDKVGDIENALDKVCSIDTMLYKHNDIAKSYGYEGDETQVGVTAQSVKEVLPEVIARAPFDIETHETDGTQTSKSGEDYMTVRYERIVPLLIEAIKDLKAEIATIKGECKCS